MNVAEILEQVRENELTVGELSEIAETAEQVASQAETRFAKLFELGDTVRHVDGRIGTVARRNVHTVSVLFRGAEDTEKVTPSDLVSILEQLEDPDNFDYFDYFG